LQYYNNAKEYLQKGDWAGYGKELEKLENILKKLSKSTGDTE
jgi:flagellin-specific chaperone FliS